MATHVCARLSVTAVFVASLGCSSGTLLAQKCVTELGDVGTVSAQLATTKQPAVVLDIAARYGDLVVPALRKLSRPERPIESPEGAAQAALAKLGDKAALQELREELEGTRVREKRQSGHPVGTHCKVAQARGCRSRERDSIPMADQPPASRSITS